MKSVWNRVIFLFYLFILSFNTNGSQLPEGFIETLIAQNLDPVSMALAPDGRIFIAEKNGKILIVRDDQLLEDPFLTLEVDNYNERGIAGIAFHPKFEENNFFYVYYTVPNANHNRVSRFTANGDYAIPGSEEVILDLDPLSGTIHNGGDMDFGPDGKLYIAVGDGARAENAQEKTNLLGKFLRINDDGSIPEDNPFYQELNGKYRAIYALGLRNPFTFDISSNGRIFSTDVGQQDYEEVNEIIAGANYGWPLIEGKRTNQTPPENYRDPVYSYSHDFGCAAVGAAFYDPKVTYAFPEEYHNIFLFGDYCEGYIKMLDPETLEIKGVFASGADRPLSLLVTEDGSFYYLERAGMGGGSEQDNTSSTNGRLWKVTYTGSGAPYISEHPQSVFLAAGESATFEVKASGAANLEYQWIKNDAAIANANDPVLLMENISTADDGTAFYCIVSNAEGSDTSNVAVLNVAAGTRPSPVIILPEEGALYRAGTSVTFSGEATDAEDGALSSDNLTWWVDFHHDTHTHPAMAPVTGISEGSFTIPTVGEVDDNVWYRIYLSAVDSEGLSSLIYKDIHPEKTSISLQTEPEGLSLNIDGKLTATPYQFLSVMGIFRTIVAPEIQEMNGSMYMFESWKGTEGGSTLQFNAPDTAVNLIAVYSKLKIGTGIGLKGYFYDTQNPDFNTSPEYSQLTPTIDFDWGGGSPSSDQLGDDFFAIRWLGELEPMFTDTYTFTTLSDDGVRLWINNQLLIDKWIPQPPTEWSGSIYLEEGKKYSVKLEYYEEQGGAVIKLFWSTGRLSRQTVPQSQLHPNLVNSTEKHLLSNVILYPNPVKDKFSIVFTKESDLDKLKEITITSVDGKDAGPVDFITNEKELTLNIQRLMPGIYFIHLVSEQGNRVFKIVKE